MNSFATRHQPRSLSDFVFEELTTENVLRQYASNQRDGNIILHGPHGAGKSSLARIILTARGGSNRPLVSNCRIGYHARTLNEQTFERILCGTWNLQLSGSQLPYCVIAEVDQLNGAFQEKLRAFMDQYSSIGCFIMTTNHLHLLDHGIADRSRVLEIPAVKPHLWRTRGKAILKAEGIDCTDAQLDDLLASTTGSVRDVLSALEDACVEHRTANMQTSS